jgi:hypothetical protein
MVLLMDFGIERSGCNILQRVDQLYDKQSEEVFVMMILAIDWQLDP